MSDWTPSPPVESEPPRPNWGMPPAAGPPPPPPWPQGGPDRPGSNDTTETHIPVASPVAPRAFEGVPLSPPESLPYPSGTSPRPPDPPRAKRRFATIVAFVVAALILLGGGGVIGYVLSEDDAPDSGAAPAAVDEPVSTEEGTDPQASPEPVIPDEPGPVGEDEDEPVAAVAAAVARSVVRIDTNGGTGSGIAYDESGLIVTNAHVVQGASEVNVQLADGTRLTGTVLGTDPAVDVAVVRLDDVSAAELTPAVFAPSSSVEVGQLAVAIGSPFGLEQSVTAGIISAVSRAVQSTNVADGSPTVVEMVQTDAPINPGNSGGALADRQGRVVGMNTSIRTDGTTQGNLGVGFAIPSDTLLLIAQRIVDGDSLEHGFLGVTGQDPTTGRAGALITEVVAGGPAEAGGIEVGDLIVAIDGDPVLGMSELAAKVRITRPGTMIDIEVVRGTQNVVLTVELGMLG